MINASKGKQMKVKSIRPVGRRKVYDISVNEAEHYVLENGVITHNTGGVYSSDTIWIVGRQQDKDTKTKEIDGYDFIINIEKSRFVKEKSKIPISVSYEGGINIWSGLLENAIEAGIINKPAPGKYEVINENGEVVSDVMKEDEIIANDELWKKLLKTSKLKQFLRDKYAVGGSGALIHEEVE